MNRWLPALPSPDDRLRLYCYPHAGAGASVFRDWPQELPSCVGVRALHPPGRESRFGEPPVDRLEDLVDGVVRAMGTELSPDVPFALFGHSLGALVVTEVVRELDRRGLPPPVLLMVSGRRAPQDGEPRAWVHELSDEDFTAVLRELGGTPDALLARPWLLQAFLPTLRADFAVNETYAAGTWAPLPVPITAFGGLDDPNARPEEVWRWRRQTTTRFRARFLPGGHFFVLDERKRLLDDVREELAPWTSCARVGP